MARTYCSVCERAIQICLCEHTQQQTAAVPTLVLRHTDETRHAKGSAILAARSLSNIRLLTGQLFAEPLCRSALAQFNARSPVLLYAPHSYAEHQEESWLPSLLAGSKQDQRLPFGCDSLITLDGTWRNTRELMLKNTWLHKLPVLSLMGFKSEYVLRKQKPNGVSTIEALDIIYRFLNKEFSTDKFLSSFRAMQAAQIAKMGDEIFLRHYAKR